MSKRKYFSIHNHTEYSNLRLLDSINRATDLIKRAREIGLAGLAITDHEVLSSHVEAVQAYQKMLKRGDFTPEEFKLALGDEIYLVPDVTQMREDYQNSGHHYYHFVLVAKDQEGYRQLKEISTTAWANSYTQRGMERTPIDYQQIKSIVEKNPGHLIGTTACLGGQLPKLVMKLEKAEKVHGGLSKEVALIKSEINDFMQFCISLFGKDDFYIEVQPSFQPEQLMVNARLKSIAAFYGVKMIFATDSHYLRKEDRFVHKSFLNSMDGEREVDDFYATAYMMEQEEVYEYLKGTFTDEEFAEMVQNSIDIADKIEVYDLYKPQIIPHVDVNARLKELKQKHYHLVALAANDNAYIRNMMNSDSEQDQYWIYACAEGMAKKGLSDRANYWKRIDMEAKELWEISDIIKDRMTKYYNTMQFIIELVWDNGNSIVGPARGSATGFLTCYLLEITQLDPIVWNLPHWRHLTSTRPELPDEFTSPILAIV